MMVQNGLVECNLRLFVFTYNVIQLQLTDKNIHQSKPQTNDNRKYIEKEKNHWMITWNNWAQDWYHWNEANLMTELFFVVV